MTDLRTAVSRLLNEVHDLRLEGDNSSLRAAANDVRAALERLIARLDETTDPNGPVPAWSDSFAAALAALAQPEPAGEVSDEELMPFFAERCIAVGRHSERVLLEGDFFAAARAAIALALSRQAPVQPVDGEVTELVEWLRCHSSLPETRRAADLLQHLAGWKESALAVERQWDANGIATMLGCQLGESQRACIQREVPRLLGRLRELEHHQPPQPAAVSERLPELRQRFEATLNGARCLNDRPVGNVELADRLLDDVLAWNTPTTPPEAP